MSKKCIKCGAELDDIAVFCDECGTKQIIQHAAEGNEKAFSKVNPKNPPILHKHLVLKRL